MRRSALQKLILAYLRSIADDKGVVRFKAEEVALAVGSYRSNVFRSVYLLEAAGELSLTTKVGRHGWTLITMKAAA